MNDVTSTPPGAGFLPDLLGIEWLESGPGEQRGRLAVAHCHLAPNGYLHAASIIALTDTACGFGCMRALPPGATSFTTIELKSNFLGAAQVGQAIACAARLVHGGRTTQVWDAEVINETTQKPVALFRCTQLLLYPKA